MHWDSIPENGSSLCQQVSIADGFLITGVTQRPFSRLRTRTLSGLTLCRSWVCCHRVCGLMCTWSLEREQGDSRWVVRVNASMKLGVGELGEGRHDQTTAYEKYLKIKKLKQASKNPNVNHIWLWGESHLVSWHHHTQFHRTLRYNVIMIITYYDHYFVYVCCECWCSRATMACV